MSHSFGYWYNEFTMNLFVVIERDLKVLHVCIFVKINVFNLNFSIISLVIHTCYMKRPSS